MQTIQTNLSSSGVLTVTMNRPEVHNAFDSTMIRELTETLQDAAVIDDVRILVITGAGSCFSAGADINWMRSQVEASQDENQRDAMLLADLMRTLNYFPKPITIAAEEAMFGLTEARLGLAPAVISPYVIRRIGERNARRYFLSAERFDSQQALAIGLVQQCVKQDELTQSVESITTDLLKGGPEAVATCKQLIYAIAGHDEESQKAVDEYTAGLIAGLRILDEGQEGLAAFLEKRKPDWFPGQG